MSLETILEAISAAGDQAVAEIEAATAAQIVIIQAEAEAQAVVAQRTARQTALQPLLNERYRRLQQAKLQALRLVSAAQEARVAAVLQATEARLTRLCDEPAYPTILRRLVSEALAALGETVAGSPPLVYLRPGDAVWAQPVFEAHGLQPRLADLTDGWGGVIVASHDGRVIVDNTLKARFERALPTLRQLLTPENDGGL